MDLFLFNYNKLTSLTKTKKSIAKSLTYWIKTKNNYYRKRENKVRVYKFNNITLDVTVSTPF